MARARLPRLERIRRRGLVAIEVDGVLARLAGKVAEDPVKRLRGMRVVAAATVLAIAIRKRVQLQHRVGSHQRAIPSYSQHRVLLSRQYAHDAGETRQYWPSAEEWRRNRPDQRGYTATGEMWKGLQVTTSGPDAARIGFEGSSLAAGATEKRIIRGRVFFRPIRKRIRNQTKANQILAAHNLNVVEPGDDQLDAMAAGVLRELAATAASSLSLAVSDVRFPGAAGRARLADDIFRALTQAHAALPQRG